MNETTPPPGPAPSDPPAPDPGTPAGPGTSTAAGASAASDPAPAPASAPAPVPEPHSEGAPDPDSEGAPVGRRTVLTVLGLGAAGVAAAPWLQRGLEAVLGSVADKDPTKLTGLLPNGGGFRYYSVAASVPRRTAADYRLTVGGLVERPAEFTLAALRRLPQTRLVRDVQCVTGWRVPDTPFEGVRLSELLDAVGVRPEARAVRFICFDGAYSESLTLDQARRSDVVVCLRMRDEPLSHAHGGPVRLYVAPMYFYKSAKWLSGISLTRDVRPGYWEERGYDIDAWVGRSNGRDDAPTV
ncbi:molybdopterin-dependent oxidoreductase [Streptomyces sp. WMMC940]|uniref:molybdopterin-dependent oxidoreductase n=1 Tax=Streptomyces sp. WMMC940 TaxID=3015153 RepID=UPI0022B6DF74|nr:molybdopterin-dependent oxidoreductase [Streptomyces sp. WMMC940]MCZ7461270.1 molybdopterin-dependent oxidoreductase [Streptomyces sp. WMMC940]